MSEHSIKLPPLWIAAFLVLCAGCGRGNFAPARGQVLVGGEPAKGAIVTPVRTPDGENDGTRVSGKVAKDGSFTLHTTDNKTRRTHMGVQPGEYIVLISWSPELTTARLNAPESVPDLFGGRYSDAKTSPLRVGVTTGVGDLPAIQLPATDLVPD